MSKTMGIFDTGKGTLIAPNGVRFTANMTPDQIVQEGTTFIRELTTKTGWTYRTTTAFTLSGHVVYFALGFENDRLRRVAFAFTDLRDEPPARRREVHDMFLAAELGAPAMKNAAFTGYDFSWGKITSASDPRTNATEIIMSWSCFSNAMAR